MSPYLSCCCSVSLVPLAATLAPAPSAPVICLARLLLLAALAPRWLRLLQCLSPAALPAVPLVIATMPDELVTSLACRLSLRLACRRSGHAVAVRVLLAALVAALAAPNTAFVLPVAALVSMPAVAAQLLNRLCRRCCPAAVLVTIATLPVPLATAPAMLPARLACPLPPRLLSHLTPLNLP